jgi:hypothetical protein
MGQSVRIGTGSECVDAIAFARDVVADSGFSPDRAWTIDVCELASGEYRVVECNSFACAGLYACHYDAVITAVTATLRS